MTARSSLFWAALLVAAALLLGFATGALTPVDERLSKALALREGAAAPALIAFLQGVSWFGGGVARWALVLILCLSFWRWVDRQAALRLFGAALVANLASSLLKTVYGRPRPDLVPHLDQVSNWSYPSGHATSVAAIVIALALLVPPRWRPAAAGFAALAILLTALSRVMLGVHWTSDVVGGTLLGAGCALAIAGSGRVSR